MLQVSLTMNLYITHLNLDEKPKIAKKILNIIVVRVKTNYSEYLNFIFLPTLKIT